MSRALLRAKWGHLHSPVDDLESFFWVVVWSVVFNKGGTGTKSAEEQDIRDCLTRGNRDEAMRLYSILSDDGEHRNITQRLRNVLFEWWIRVRDRYTVWSKEVLKSKLKDAGGEYYLPHFHRYALQGVVDVLEVFADHWNDEISSESSHCKLAWKT